MLLKRKEGAVIEETNADQWAEYNYKRGYRAYVRFGTRLFCEGNWSKTLTESFLHGRFWHALRAYQDEQRKKGVPIKWDWSMVGSLPGQAVYGISRGHNYLMPCVAVNPIYDEDGMIKTMTGQFTNFRWREGYPKEKHKVRIGPDYLSVIYPPFDLNPKGGHNG